MSGIPDFSDPVLRLIDLGESSIGQFGKSDWYDYRQLGLTEEHIPELIRIMTEFNESNDGRLTWSLLHAWRALGQLRAAAAAKPLLDLYEELPDDDWLTEESSKVLGAIGIGALEPTIAHLNDESISIDGRIAALTALPHIAERDPEARGRCVEVVRDFLRKFRDNEPDLNAFAVFALVDMNVREALPLIERAYREDMVDQIVADWGFVERHFGFKTTRPDLIPPRRNIFD